MWRRSREHLQYNCARRAWDTDNMAIASLKHLIQRESVSRHAEKVARDVHGRWDRGIRVSRKIIVEKG
jgi:hypothetical protein